MPQQTYNIAAQAPGTIWLKHSIKLGATSRTLSIPDGAINIGGHGKGYTIDTVQYVPIDPPLISNTVYVVYATNPIDGSGKVQLKHVSYTTYSGDNDSQRVIGTFKTDSADPTNIDESTIRTYSYDFEVLEDLLKNSNVWIDNNSPNFFYGGQSYDEKPIFDVAVQHGDLVYKNTDGKYYQAIANDTAAERVVGVVQKNRLAEPGNDFVIFNGIVNIGTTVLPNVNYPANTILYLSPTTAGKFTNDTTTYFSGNKKIRVGVSLGNGIIVLVPTLSSLDDHDESSYAHQIIQTALNKAGIYVLDTTQGKTEFAYRGQSFDEKATFTSVADGDRVLVYKHADNTYHKALAGSNNVEGISYGVVGGQGTVLTQGFVGFNTALFAIGDKLYLHESTAGSVTTTPSSSNQQFIGTVLSIGTVGTGGFILLNINSTNLHNENPLSHLLIRQSLERHGIFVTGATDLPQAYRGQSVDTSSTFEGSVVNLDAVYKKINGNYDRALANNSVTQQFIGFKYGNNVVTQGYINIGSNNPYSIGTDVYLSDTLPGKLTNTVTRVFVGISMGNGVILISTNRSGSGTGDVTFEDISYINALQTSGFNLMYYDAFTKAGTVTGTVTYQPTTTSYSGVLTNTLTSDFILDAGTYYYFKLVIDKNPTLTFSLVEISYNSGVNWINITSTYQDIITNTAGFTTLQLRLTYGGTGNVYGIGVLYGDPVNTLVSQDKMFETVVLTSGIIAGNNFTLPNNARYINDGKHLSVYRNRQRLVLNTDYSEIDDHTIQVLTTNWVVSDIITVEQYYGRMDFSINNSIRLDAEHNDAGQHILIDTVTNQPYRIVVENGILKAITI